MNSVVPRVDLDSRTRYQHQAYDITFGGRPLEGGAAGYGRRLSATYQANFQVTIDVSDTEDQYFTLPPFVYCNKYVVVEGSQGAPTANIAVADPSDIAGTATTIAAAAPLGSTMGADTPLDSNIDVEPFDQIIRVQVSAPDEGYATLLLKCDIVQTGWK